MGQKTNPIIFKISKTNQWKATYTEKKSNEFYLYTLQQLEIKKFINNFFSKYSLKIKECKINYKDTFLNIHISYYQSKLLSKLLVNNNKIQKIKTKYTKRFIRKKKLFKILKNTNNLCNFKYYNDLIYFKKLFFFQTKLKLIENKKQYKFKRLKLLNFYKQYIKLLKKKNFNLLNINSIFENFFESLNIFLNKKIKISVTLEPLNAINKRVIKKKEHSFIKNKLIKIKKYDRSEFFKEGVNLIYIALKNKKSSELLANFISITLQRNKKHNFFLRFLKKCLVILKSRNSPILSIKIKIKGRFNKSRRARQRTIFIGKRMPLLTFDSNINYAESISITPNGTFGIKVWIYEKNSNK